MLEFNFLKQYFCTGDYGLHNKLGFSCLAGSLVLQTLVKQLAVQ